LRAVHFAGLRRGLAIEFISIERYYFEPSYEPPIS